jgi:hypothetical protein
MDSADRQHKLDELAELQQRVAQLQREVEAPPKHWQAEGFYTAYYATAGFMLGMFGAMTSLLFNVVGSALINQHPLRLIQIYLTFPLGQQALELNGGLTLVIGCCLYIGTGMLLGVPFHLLLTWSTANSKVSYRYLVATILAASMWLVHFYLILAWLQPLLFEGNWIVEQIPWWIGLVTHLIYGWTMALVYPLGQYVPYRRQTEQA